MAREVEISVDFECVGDTWWSAAREASGCPLDSFEEWLQRTDDSDLHVTAEQAEQIKAWSAALPGWADGPSWACNPIRFKEIPDAL